MGGARQPLGCVRLGASSRPGPLCSPGAAASLQLPPAPRGLHPCQNIPTGWEQPRDHPGGTHGVDSVMAPCGCARIEVGAEQAGVHPQNTFRSPSLMELSGDTRPGVGTQGPERGLDAVPNTPSMGTGLPPVLGVQRSPRGASPICPSGWQKAGQMCVCLVQWDVGFFCTYKGFLPPGALQT